VRVLMLAQSYSPVVGGEERIVEDLSVELVRRGHEVAVATLRQPMGEPPERGDGVAVHLVRSGIERLGGDPERNYAPPGPDPVTVRDLRRVVAEFRPEVVHGHNWLYDSYLPLDRRGGPALVLSLHDYSLVCLTKRFFLDGEICSGPAAGKCLRHSLDYYGPAKGTVVAAAMRVAEPWARRRADLMLPVSAAVRDLSGLGEGEGVRVVPNFIGELPAPPAPDDEQLAALPAEPFILYFGDVTEDKGAAALLHAYGQLDSPPPLVLIGRPLLEEGLDAPGVHALGRLPHAVAVEAVRRSLFTVAPSILPESFGIVALEAGAAGKAAVVSDIGGLRDVVVDGETGLLVAPGEVEPLRAALARLVADPALAARMGEAAARRVRLHFSPEAVVPMFEGAYEDALAVRRRRA
jgi:glycosyltransferase involved in cell wall biosynthesis